MLTGKHVNLLVALSNIFGVRLLTRTYHPLYTPLSWAMVIASTLMHLSEQKHSLPGIYPFNKFSTEFLWFDRIMSYVCIMIVLGELYVRWNTTPLWLILYGCVGLFLVGVSEQVVTDQWLWFVISHSLWHYIAYDVFDFMTC